MGRRAHHCKGGPGRGASGDNRGMQIEYSREKGPGPTYEIEADRHGNYTIKLGGKVLKRVTVLSRYVGKPRWGSKKLEADAIEDAKLAVESFKTAEG